MPRRVTSWLILVWNAIFAVWIVGGIITRPSKECLPGDSLCQDASDAGTSIGVGLVLMLWFLGFVVLSLVWLMTRRPRRLCAGCGHDLARGAVSCQRCGFRLAPAPTPGGTEVPPPPRAGGAVLAGVGAAPSPAVASSGAQPLSMPVAPAPAPAPAAAEPCTGCGEALVAGDRFCRRCGSAAGVAPAACPGCGTPRNAGDRFCTGCGSTVPAGVA